MASKPLRPKNMRASVSAIQKKEILKFMEKHRDVANKTLDQGMLLKIWERFATKTLNTMFGASKPGKKWMKSWDNMVRYAIGVAKTSAEVITVTSPNSELAAYFSDEDDELDSNASKNVTYTTHNLEVDAIMKIIGWEQAFISSSNWLNDSQDSSGADDDKENDEDWTPALKVKSPKEAWPKPPPAKLKRSSLGQSTALQAKNFVSASMGGSPNGGCNCSCADMSMDVKSNTAALENLTKEMNEIKQVLLANLQPQTFTILNVDEAGAGASPINIDTEDVENGEGEVNFDFPDLN